MLLVFDDRHWGRAAGQWGWNGKGAQGVGESEELGRLGKKLGGREQKGYLDDDEASAGIVGALEVDVGLVVGYVEALDCRPLLEGGGSGCGAGQG